MIPFKVNDFIIATAPHEVEGHTLAGVAVQTKDRSFMGSPIKIIEITEAHIVYKTLLTRTWAATNIMSFYELEECNFVVANSILVEATWKDYKEDD